MFSISSDMFPLQRKVGIQLSQLPRIDAGIDVAALFSGTRLVETFSLEYLQRGIGEGIASGRFDTFPMWPVAIPNPFSYYTSFGNFTPASEAIYTAFTGQAWNQCEPGHYVVFGSGLSSSSPFSVTVATRNYVWKIYRGPVFTVTFGNNNDDIVATITVGGTGGYTCTRTMRRGFTPLSQLIHVPEPWDELRTITVTWTGGTTSASLTQWYFSNVIDVATEVPSGWTPHEWTGHVGRPLLNTYNQVFHARKSEGVVSGPDQMIRWTASARSYLYRRASHGNHLDNLDLASNVHDAAECVDGSGSAPSLTQRQPIRPGEDFAGHAGYPIMDGGVWKRSLCGPPIPGNDTVFSGPSAAAWFPVRIRSLRKLYFGYNSGSPATLNVDAGNNADWKSSDSGVTPATVFYSGSFAHTGSGWEFFEIPITPLVPFTDGSKCAMLMLRLTGGIVVAIHDPWPSPTTIVTDQDGLIPGAFHADNVEPTAGVTVVDGGYPDVSFADIPSDVKAFTCRITDVPDGVYRVLQYTIAGAASTAEWLGTTPLCRFRSTGPLFVNTGEVYVAPATTVNGWGSYGKSASASRTLDRLELYPVTLAHNTLSIGTQDIGNTISTWGYAGTGPYAFSNQRFFMFQQFVAPSTGTYRFTLSVPSGSSVLLTTIPLRAAIWYSTSDPLCAHAAPDVQEDINRYVIAQSSSAPVTSPPAALASTLYTSYLINDGTGAWAGLSGAVAVAQQRGYVGADLDWRVSSPPEGATTWTNVSGTNTNMVKRGGRWEERLTLATFDVPLEAGQTLYLRIGDTGPAAITPSLYGSGIITQFSSTNGASYAINMTVAAV